jgi:hypothetical protein
MYIALAVVGVALVGLILWEVFNDLFHPSGTGALSDWLGRGIFTALKRCPRSLPLAGPLALVTVIATWLARGVSHLVTAEKQSGLSIVDTGSDVVLNSLAGDVTHARIDLVHFPIVARRPGRPERVRVAGAALDAALHDFAAILEERFLHTAARDRERIFQSFERDHLVATQGS